jgi:hypothetical protein
MTDKQILAVRCAYADLVGALQAREALDMNSHDWKAHKQSIDDLEQAFPELVEQFQWGTRTGVEEDD